MVWRRSVGPIQTTWIEEARLVARGDSPGRTRDQFGAAVSISGNLIAVGAPARHQAYVFRRDGETWVREAALGALEAVNYGASVALRGDRLVVGAPNTAGTKSGLIGADELPSAAYVLAACPARRQVSLDS